MKKFLTYISMQPENGLCKVKYKPMDMDDLKVERDVFFPISILVDNYAVGEEIEIICMMDTNNPDEKNNLNRLKEEVAEIIRVKDIKINYVIVPVLGEENIGNHLTTFEGIIGHINDGDRLYACATYGTKPIPIIEMIALNYVYRVKKDVSVEKIVYGKISRLAGELKSAIIYNITALFSMDQIVNHLAENKVAEPDKAIKMLLGIGE